MSEPGGGAPATGMSPECVVRPVTDGDLEEIAALNAAVLGPGRFARSAYRAREGLPRASPYCRVATLGGRIIAACRLAPVTIGGKAGALMLGPLVVHRAHANLGYGRRLIRDGIEAARAASVRLIVLVGDEPYYGRLGFVRVGAGQMAMPGPADPARMLALALAAGSLDNYRGEIKADLQPR